MKRDDGTYGVLMPDESIVEVNHRYVVFVNGHRHPAYKRNLWYVDGTFDTESEAFAHDVLGAPNVLVYDALVDRVVSPEARVIDLDAHRRRRP